jgi:hypothetical protein
MLSRFTSFLTVAAYALSTVNAAAIPKRADPCNGRPEFCDRSYGAITFIGAHNSYAHSENPLALARNQQVDVKEQLKRGVRLLQGQGHQKDGKVHLCHTSCDLLDAGPAEDYFKDVKGFLDANPREVLTIIMTNQDGLDMQSMWAPAFTAAGLDQLAFIPPSQPVAFDKWPTLGEMINSGKRVVIFMDSGADTAKVPFILPEFDNIWENEFSTTDPAFPCKVDRITGPLSPEQHMYMINHSLNEELFGISELVIPNFLEASTTNSAKSIVDNANGCAPLAGNRKPNFVLLDWIDIGEPFRAADTLNGF